MKFTITIDGNSIEDLNEVLQELADKAGDNIYPYEVKFENWKEKPKIEVEWDEEENEQYDDGYSYKEQVRSDFIDGIMGR
jgi:hypothetical protein